MTALATVLWVAALFTSLYPRVMVSSPNFGNSLTVDGASSAHYTLAVMTVVALIPPAHAPLPGLDVPRVPGPGGGGEVSRSRRRLARGLTVRALDQRLLRRARPVRRLLALDVVLGLAAAVLVLVQATLLARIVARAFEGASLADVSRDLVLLALAFAGRGALAWGFELAGRRAAASVLSGLPAGARSAQAPRPAARARRGRGGRGGRIRGAGRRGTRAYFARYLRSSCFPRYTDRHCSHGSPRSTSSPPGSCS
jgi:hypothetical protein